MFSEPFLENFGWVLAQPKFLYCDKLKKWDKVAVGVTYRYEKKKQDNKNWEKELNKETGFMGYFQASLLGIETSLQKNRGFAEFGKGEQDIVHASVHYKF